MASSTVPTEYSAIHHNVSSDDIWVIVTIHHPLAYDANWGTPHLMTIQRDANGIPNGNHLFLRRIIPHHIFWMGRDVARDRVVGARAHLQDVYLPGASVALQQCVLVPDWNRNLWRLESRTKMIATVNGTSIQDHTVRTKGLTQALPSFVYLKQSEINIVDINGMQVDIWLMKSVRQAYQAHELPQGLVDGVRNVINTPQGIVDRCYLTREQVSARSYRVVDRFTGEACTAKLFRSGEDAQQLRDREFLTFNKQQVDASIVRYQQSVAVDEIPAIITDSYSGYVSFAELREKIRGLHPGIRFSIATKLVRRLLPALAWTHFNEIIHGHVSGDSVLLRMVDAQVEHVLLVDYTTARPFAVGVPEPHADMIADGQSAMQLVEECCDIWAFRNGPTVAAMGESFIQKHIQDALHKYQLVQRVCADFYSSERNSHESEEGIKLDRLLNKLTDEYQSAKVRQVQNFAEREVANMSKPKIEAKIEEWESANGSQYGVHKQYMILSLGHSFLDGLAQPLHFGRWDLKPSEICAQIREHGGELEEPWQTFEVRLTTPLEHDAGGYSEAHIMAWLAACCEVYPEWREVIDKEYNSHTRSSDRNVIPANTLHNLRLALQAHGKLPVSMSVMFNHIPSEMATPQEVEESFRVWYHIPSRMFNLTQLQRLATPARLAAMISEGRTRCDNFVEVRGDPKLQGNYAPLTLLGAFAEQLGLRLPETPNLSSTIPSFDPSDFSQVPQGRIVLARPGLLGFGSMLRSGDQASFLYSRTNSKFIMPSAFIPTYFGDMKVLPTLPNNRNYDRPTHWSKFRTSEEHEASADLDKRKKLLPIGPMAAKDRFGRSHSPDLSDIMEMDESELSLLLEERERIRSEARPPATRNADEMSSANETVDPKRSRPDDEDAGPSNLPEISRSFIQRMEDRNQASSSSGPQVPVQPTLRPGGSFGARSFLRRNFMDPNVSFTVADDDEGLEEAWEEVNLMLYQMPAEDDEPEVQGLTGFRFHNTSGSDEDDETSRTPSVTDKGEEKATTEAQAFFDAEAWKARSASQSFRQSMRKTQTSIVAPFKKGHRRNKSGLSDVTHSSDLPATQPSSPTPRGPHTPSGQTAPPTKPANRPTLPVQVMDQTASFAQSMPGTNPDMSPDHDMPPAQANSLTGVPNLGMDFDMGGSFGSDMPPTEAGSPTAPVDQVPDLGSDIDMNQFVNSDMPPTKPSSPTPSDKTVTDAQPPVPNFGHGFNENVSFGSDMLPTEPNSPDALSRANVVVDFAGMIPLGHGNGDDLLDTDGEDEEG